MMIVYDSYMMLQSQSGTLILTYSGPSDSGAESKLLASGTNALCLLTIVDYC